MLEKADEVLVGVSILMKAAKVTKGYIGIENNKPDAIKLMTEKAAQYPGIEVVPLQVKYPQGGEKQLIGCCDTVARFLLLPLFLSMWVR